MTNDTMTRRVYPRLTDVVWWALRKQFQRTMPATVTQNYMATVLKLNAGTARSVITNLQYMGLLDDDAHPTALANAWRDDNSYPQACKQMFAAIYPDELKDIAPPPDVDRGTVQTWFMRELATGSESARQLAALYVLLAVADPSGPTPKTTKTSSSEPRPATKPRAAAPRARASKAEVTHAARPAVALPTPQIAVQVNIDPSMSPEQIDQVFRSMAEHLYGRTE
ncbi:MAG: DUF5343 domain-containing protein [Chloroflexota bacterium]